MASELRIVALDVELDLCQAARSYLVGLESLWSRFIESSDISRINRSSGATVDVAAETITLVATMIEAWRLTGGRYDPGMLPSVVANGYATSREDPTRVTTLAAGATSSPGAILDVAVDAQRSTVTAPVGLALDPGGIGKGLAADLTVGWLLARGAAGALVAIGGDLVVAGTAPSPDGWTIAVERPDPAADDWSSLVLNGGGVATSSTLSRRWVHDGRDCHHLVDPTTGAQSGTDLVAVTVVTTTGWAAEAHATAALLVGSDGVLDYLAGRSLSGIAFAADGAVLMTEDLLMPDHEQAAR
jgi:thiamine biosynthesis lipoprotein